MEPYVLELVGDYSDEYLVYSTEHRGYWNSNHFGYTLDPAEAAVMPLDEAKEIAEQANRFSSCVEEWVIPKKLAVALYGADPKTDRPTLLIA